MHALTTLNDPTWIEAARCLAQVAIKNSQDNTEQLQWIAKRLLARSFTDPELNQMRNALDKQLRIFQADRDAAIGLLNVGELRRDEGLDPVQHAALTNICLTVMNLDEALNRE